MRKMKSYKAEFKFKVALEMVRGDLSISEIVNKYSVPRSVLDRWKKRLVDQGSIIYKSGSNNYSNTGEKEIEKLHKTIGKLKVENDFLQDVWSKLK